MVDELMMPRALGLPCRSVRVLKFVPKVWLKALTRVACCCGDIWATDWSQVGLFVWPLPAPPRAPNPADGDGAPCCTGERAWLAWSGVVGLCDGPGFGL